jgi:hypothetical protein
VREHYIVRESAERESFFWYCKIFSCVRRSSPAVGCAGRGEKERKKIEDLLAESARSELYALS